MFESEAGQKEVVYLNQTFFLFAIAKIKISSCKYLLITTFKEESDISE
jgi:hypothetical protein